MQQSERFLGIVSDTISLETGGDKSGAYTNDPKDAGKETKWGISAAANPKVNIKTLTYKDAIAIYYTKYWHPLYDLIPDETLAFKLFDLGVLFGPKIAVKYLQKSIKAIGGLTIAVDGNFGPLTITALNIAYTENNGTQILADYLQRFETRVAMIVALKPWNRKFQKGWLNRIRHEHFPKLSVVKGGKKNV